jgi:mannose-1-phosphate guanylyltransferase
MVLRPMPHGEAYAAVEVEASGAVQRIAGRGLECVGALKGWHFSGIHVIEPRLLEHIAAAGEVCVNRQVYLPAIERGERVHGHVVQEGYWSDLGTPERFLSTQGEVMMGALDFEKFPGVSPLSPASRSGIWAQLGAKYARAVVTAAPAWLGPKAVLEPGARVGPNAAVNGTVHPGAEVVDAALLDGEVAPGERLYRAIRLGGKTATCK